MKEKKNDTKRVEGRKMKQMNVLLVKGGKIQINW